MNLLAMGDPQSQLGSTDLTTMTNVYAQLAKLVDVDGNVLETMPGGS